jgi:hypothetical protein
MLGWILARRVAEFNQKRTNLTLIGFQAADEPNN